LRRDGYDAKRIWVENHVAHHQRTASVNQGRAAIRHYQCVGLQHTAVDNQFAMAHLQHTGAIIRNN
jgi:hypothetical protein